MSKFQRLSTLCVGKCPSVPWQWVMMQEVVLTGFCTPTALLSPENTIDVTHSCGASCCTQVRPSRLDQPAATFDVWDEIDIALRKYLGSVDNVHCDRAEPTPRNPAPMSSTLSSGSIEVVGLQAAEPQNMGVACDCLAQGSKFL